MPRKLPRRSDAGDLAPIIQPTLVPLNPQTAFILGGAHVTHGAIQAGAQVTSAAVTAAGRVLEASIQSFGECFCAFMGYMQEREITARVVAQEREITARVIAQEEAATARMQAWSTAMIAEAQAKTEEVRTQATLVLATIEDRKGQRESKLTVIHGFMSAYQRWNAMLTDALASRADRMPLDERELLQQHIETLLRRAREMEHAIASIAVTL
jgi:hypothetical protein